MGTSQHEEGSPIIQSFYFTRKYFIWTHIMAYKRETVLGQIHHRLFECFNGSIPTRPGGFTPGLAVIEDGQIVANTVFFPLERKWSFKTALGVFSVLMHCICRLKKCIHCLMRFKFSHLWSRVLSDSSHLCSHEGQGVHAIRSSQQSTDHSQAATGQQQGHQQANHSNVAVHGGGRRERELQKEKIYHVESGFFLPSFFDFPLCFLKMWWRDSSTYLSRRA